MDILERIDVAEKRQGFRMCVPPEQTDTDIVLCDCKREIESLRQQLAAAQEENKELIFSLQASRSNNRDLRNELAAALVACGVKDEALKDTLYFLERHSNRWDGVNGKHPQLVVDKAREALAIKPDASALKAHDEALIERVASFVQNMDEVNAARIARATRELKSQL